MILLRLNLFHFAIVEDREVFWRYDLSRPGNAEIAGYGQFRRGQAELALPALRPSETLLDGAGFYHQRRRASTVFCITERSVHENESSQFGFAIFLNIFTFLRLVSSSLHVVLPSLILF